MKRFLRWLFGWRVEYVPVLLERGEFRKLLTQEELEQMRRVWKLTLRGRSKDPCVKVIMEMIEQRICQASGTTQRRDYHQGANGRLVSYSSGEAAGLNDFLLELVRMTHAAEEDPR